MNFLSRMRLQARLITGLCAVLIILGSGVVAVNLVLKQHNTEAQLALSGEYAHEIIASQIKKKQDTGLAVATAIAFNKAIATALAEGDHRQLQADFAAVRSHFANHTNFKNIAVELIDANGQSLFNSVAPDGPVPAANSNTVAQRSLDSALAQSDMTMLDTGLVLSSAVPVTHAGKLVGVVVVNQGLRSVDSDLSTLGNFYMLVVDPTRLTNATLAERLGRNSPLQGGYVPANDKWFRTATHEAMSAADMAQVVSQSVTLAQDHVYASIPVTDTQGNTFAWHVVAQPRAGFDAALGERNGVADMMVLAVLATAALMLTVNVLMVRALITRPLSRIQARIVETTDSGDLTLRLPDTEGADELSVLSRSYNGMLDQLNRAFEEITDVARGLAQGHFDKQVRNHYRGDLQRLSQAINETVTGISNTMNTLSELATALREGEFSHQCDTRAPGAYGQMLDNLTQAMSDLSLTVDGVNGVMDSLAGGDFSRRVSVTAKGDLGLLKDRVNRAADSVNRAVDELSRVLQAQSQGDLTQHASSGFRGDLQSLMATVNKTNDRLNGVITGFTQSAAEVASAAAEVNQGSRSTTEQAQNQATEITRTGQIMRRINETVKNNREIADQARQLTEETKSRAMNGNEVMHQTIESMSAVREQSREITDITNLIDDIAFQTNLLALNASVEAARAGEHGAGFAVVASEVRNLASKSADAAHTIKELVRTSVETIESGTENVNRSGEILFSISESVVEVNDIIGQIIGASNEQADSIRDINNAMTGIEEMTQEYAAVAGQSLSASEALTDEAARMTQAMTFFRVKNAANDASGEKQASGF
ncbi:methyl-accepting chemotaxis protein [Granulosicoccaceae sp. 1_MG-2023]|nr:methyl-accepting chemotaxis protein [Granulosicoccaceae sp. 1_MG-2023]